MKLDKSERYIHDQRVGQEIIFLTLSHSKECESLTVKEMRELSRRLWLNLPYHSPFNNKDVDLEVKEKFGDTEANANEAYGARFLVNKFKNSVT